VLSAKVGARTCSVIGNRDGGKAEGCGGAGATCDWPTMVTSGDKSPARFHWYSCYLTVDFDIYCAAESIYNLRVLMITHMYIAVK